MNTELGDKLNKLYEENTLFQDFNGYILIKAGNEVVFQQSFGYTDYSLKKTANENTIYSIASLTKQFTAVCVLQLEQKGLLSIDDKVTKYLPDFIHGKELVIRDLLNMVSGIPEYWCQPEWQESDTTTVEDTYSFIRTLPDYQSPRKQFVYCNSNYVVLSKLIETVSGLTLDNYMKKNIFDPLEMTRTSILSVNRDDTNLAIGYKSPQVSKWEKAPVIPSSFAGAGGIFSTAADLRKWDDALYTGKLLCNELLQELFKPVLSGYAMGWYVNGTKAYHGGDLPGFSAKITRFMDQRLLLLLLSNFDGCKESNMSHYSDMAEKLIIESNII